MVVLITVVSIDIYLNYLILFKGMNITWWIWFGIKQLSLETSLLCLNNPFFETLRCTGLNKLNQLTNSVGDFADVSTGMGPHLPQGYAVITSHTWGGSTLVTLTVWHTLLVRAQCIWQMGLGTRFGKLSAVIGLGPGTLARDWVTGLESAHQWLD